MKNLVLTLSAALLVTACSADAEPSPEPEPTTERSVAPAPSREPSAEPVSTFVDPWVPVACDVDRPPSDVEAAYLVEAGPHVDTSAEEAAAAVLAMRPSSAEEWSAAILATVHGDTGEGMCEMMRLSFDLGESAATPEGPDAPTLGRNHFAIVLDASGSMAARSGGGTRMEQAKQAIATFVAELPTDSTVSLRIHGHEGSNQLRAVYEEQLGPVHESFQQMRSHLEATDLRVNSVERDLQIAGAFDWDTFSQIIRLNDAHIQRGRDYLDEFEPRLQAHGEELLEELLEVYGTSTAWREFYRDN